MGYNENHRHFSYDRADEFPSKESNIDAVERETGPDGCALVMVMPLIGLGIALMTVFNGIKWG